jgi:GT2 family glycosyltransferase
MTPPDPGKPSMRGGTHNDAGAPLVSVVVATHQRPRFLADCLRSIVSQSWARRELVVVLDPADGESETVAEAFGARVIRTHRALGSFAACNIGIANSNGDFIMLVDDDATFESDDALERLVRYLLGQEGVMIAVANIHGLLEAPPQERTRPVFLFKAGFALYRREVFERVAGFFPDLFTRAGGETFLANRIYAAGGVVAVVHDAWLYHAQTAVGRHSYAMNFHSVRSHALLALLQEPWPIVPLSLGSKLGSTLVRIAIQRRDPLAWLSGWLSFLGWLPWAVRNRDAIPLRTYLFTRRLRRDAGQVGRVVIRQSAEAA